MNPDLLCNQKIKFSALFKHLTRTLGVDRVATGHYARLQHMDDGNVQCIVDQLPPSARACVVVWLAPHPVHAVGTGARVDPGVWSAPHPVHAVGTGARVDPGVWSAPHPVHAVGTGPWGLVSTLCNPYVMFSQGV